MSKAYSEHVPNVAQRNECGKAPGGNALSKDVAEEEASNDDLGLGQLCLGDGGKVGDVGQHVENGDTHHGDGCCDRQCPFGVLELSKDVVGVLPALVAVDDLQHCRGKSVGTTAPVAIALLHGPNVVKVVRVWDQSIPSQGREARKDDDQKHENFEDSQRVGKSQPPLRESCVQADNEGDAQNRDGSSNPAIRQGVANREQHISAKSERVAGREAKKDHLDRENTGCQERWLLEDPFEVVLFAARQGDRKSEFQVNAQAGQCEKAGCDMSVRMW